MKIKQKIITENKICDYFYGAGRGNRTLATRSEALHSTTKLYPHNGGDEESRTPVHNTFHIDFYKFSLFLKFILDIPTNRFI